MIQQYALIIGAMKSGTTTLFDSLAAHPQICPCFPKEPGFFAFEDRWAEGFGWYENLFDFDPAAHVYGLDGSTDYSKHPFCAEVPRRLADSAPRRFKLIYMLRHPLRRIESHAYHVQHNHCEVGQLPSIRGDHGLDAGISPVSMATAHYAAQLDQYRDAVDRGDLLILIFEDFVRDNAAALARIFDFLGLDPYEIGAMHSNKADAGRQAPGYWHMLNQVRPLAATARALVPQRLRHGLRDRLSREVEVPGRFKLTTAEEARILAELTPDLVRLRDVYGVDIHAHWDLELA